MQVSLLPHRLLLLLNHGDWTPADAFQLSVPWEIITPQRALTPFTHYTGSYQPVERLSLLMHYCEALYPLRDDYYPSQCTLVDSAPITILTSHYVPWVILHCPLLKYFVPYLFSHNSSGFVVCFYIKGNGLGTSILNKPKRARCQIIQRVFISIRIPLCSGYLLVVFAF